MRAMTLILTLPVILSPAAAQAQDGSAPADTAAPTTVVVTAPKTDVVKRIDKTVYNPANEPKAVNGSAQDVLQSAPGVSVTADGALSVKGDGHVTVLIDGRPSAAMTGDNRAAALQTMAGSDIASVEVITNPSAAYNANGGAIINIVLKSDRKPGLHGAVRGSVSDQGLWNANATGDYSRGRLSLHLNAGLRRDASLKFRSSDVDWRNPAGGESGENTARSKVLVRRLTQNLALGADYDLDAASTLSAAATWHDRQSRPFVDEAHRDDVGGVLSDIYRRRSLGPNQQADDSVSLSYSRQGRHGLLKASLQHGDTDALIDKSYEDVPVVPAGAATFAHIATRTAHHLDEAGLDYTRPLTDTVQLGMGLDLRNDVDRIGNLFAAVDPSTGAQTVDPARTNRYRAATDQDAAYVTGQFSWGAHWDMLAGLRLEALRMRLQSDGAAAAGPRYATVDPSLHLKYALDPHRSLTLSYRQSVERPDAGDLDPRITYVDAQNLSSGNPDLKPQGLKAIELGYDHDDPVLTRGFGLFWRRSTDTVVDSHVITAGNVILTSRQNGAEGTSTGATASAEWKPLKSLRVTGDASLYAVRLETMDLDGPVKQEAMSYQANLAVDYSRGADDVAIDAHVQGAGISPQRRTSATDAVNLSWKRRLSKRLGLTLNANDVLDGSKQSFRVRTATFDQRGYNHFEVRRIYIGLVWKAG